MIERGLRDDIGPILVTVLGDPWRRKQIHVVCASQCSKWEIHGSMALIPSRYP